MAKHPAFFFDRDGKLIDDVGYIRQSSEVSSYSFTFETLSILQEYFLFFTITNQSGIAKAITTEKEVSGVNKYIINTLKNSDIVVYDTFCGPFKSEDNCEYKKPKMHFSYKAHQLYNFDLSLSYIIGDHPSDVKCGLNAGITPIYLLTGHGQKHRNEISKETFIYSNLLEASKYIILKNNQI